MSRKSFHHGRNKFLVAKRIAELLVFTQQDFPHTVWWTNASIVDRVWTLCGANAGTNGMP
jgi:hypothetical protein